MSSSPKVLIAQCILLGVITIIIAVLVAQVAYLQRRMDAARPSSCPVETSSSQESTSSIRAYMLKINVGATMALQSHRQTMLVPDQIGMCHIATSNGTPNGILGTVKGAAIPAMFLVLRGRSRSTGGSQLQSDIENGRVRYIIVEGCTYFVTYDARAAMLAKVNKTLVAADDIFLLVMKLGSQPSSTQQQQVGNMICRPLNVQAPIMPASLEREDCLRKKVAAAASNRLNETLVHAWGYGS